MALKTKQRLIILRFDKTVIGYCINGHKLLFFPVVLNKNAKAFLKYSVIQAYFFLILNGRFNLYRLIKVKLLFSGSKSVYIDPLFLHFVKF